MRVATVLFCIAALTPRFAAAQDCAPSEILVRMRPATATAQAVIPGSSVVERLGRLGVYRLGLPGCITVDQAISVFRSRPDVEFAEPNYIAHAHADVVPNDPLYLKPIAWGSIQWELAQVQAGAGWGIMADSWLGVVDASAVKVAVLDSGYTPTHEDVGNVVSFADFTSTGILDGDGHGTHTSGTVAAHTNNSLGVAAIGWNASLMIGKVLDNTATGTYSWIINGIQWAKDNGANVISMSLGGNNPSAALEAAVNDAAAAGITIVVSAGNNKTTRRSYPAYYPACIAVAATDAMDAKASFSSYGSWVDVAAPGVNITSLWRDGSYSLLSGTSMAAPLVAGLAALVRAQYPLATAEEVRTRLTSPATTDLVTEGFGKYPIGRINAFKALSP